MSKLKISDLEEVEEFDDNGKAQKFYVIKAGGHRKGNKRKIGRVVNFQPVPKVCEIKSYKPNIF